MANQPKKLIKPAASGNRFGFKIMALSDDEPADCPIPPLWELE